jgi:hypothetical protein
LRLRSRGVTNAGRCTEIDAMADRRWRRNSDCGLREPW